MNVNSENTGKQTLLVSVTINPEDYKDAYIKACKELAKKANIPGFRKGMTPLSMIQRMQGKSILFNEILDLTDKAYQNYLTELDIKLFMKPILVNAEDLNIEPTNIEKSYTLVFETGIYPEADFSLLTNSGIEFINYVPNLTDEYITSEIERLQKSNSKTILLEENTPLDKSDVLTVTIEEVDENGIIIENGIKNSTAFNFEMMKDGEEQDKVFNLQLNESAVINLFDAFNNTKETIAKQLLSVTENIETLPLQYRITINKITRLQLMPLDEDFFALIYPDYNITDESTFRENIKQEIQRTLSQQSEKILQFSIKKAMESSNMQLPLEYIKKLYYKEDDTFVDNEQNNESMLKAVKVMIWNEIIENLAGITVSEEEVFQSIYYQMSYSFKHNYGVDMPYKTLLPLVKKQMEDAKYREDIEIAIKKHKVSQYLIKELLPIKDEIISIEDYFNLLETYQSNEEYLETEPNDEGEVKEELVGQ